MDNCAKIFDTLSKRKDLCFWCGKKSESLKERSVNGWGLTAVVCLCELCFGLNIDTY
jgi:hypothetical protein